MTHSEQLEKSIYQVKNEIGFYIANCAKEESSIVAHLRLVLNILLDEQERILGCEKCNKQSCGNCSVGTFDGDYCIQANRVAYEAEECEMFKPNNFCYNCGRSLTEYEREHKEDE